MKSQIWRSAGILAFSGICAKSFDFAFRAFYSQRLGAEGMGLLSLGFGIHGVMLTVATAGLGVAVSKIVSEYLEEHQFSAVRQCMNLAIWGVGCLGLGVMLLTFLGAEWIGTRILGDSRICAGLCCLVPSVLFMGISYCLKGYFYAARKVWIPASSEFLEQAVKFLSILLFLRWFLPKGVAYGCAAIFAGISVGEFSSCLYLSLFYLKESRSLQGGKEAERILPSLLQVSFPSMLSSLTGSSLRMQEEVFIVAALKRFGFSHQAAVSGLGIVHGMVMPMLVFPLTLMGSVTTLLVPEVARRNDSKQKARLKRLVSKVYRLGIGIGVVELLAFLFFAGPLAQMVYRNTEMVPMLRTLAVLTPVMVLDTLSCAMLNGMGKQFFLLAYSVSDALLRLIAIYLLVPRFGMPALVWVIAGSNLFTCALSIRQVKKGCNPVRLTRKIHFFRRECRDL